MQSHHLTNPKTCPTAWGHFLPSLQRVIFIADRSDTSEAINNLSALHDEHALRSAAERDRAGAAESDRLGPDASAFAQPGHGATRIR